MNSSYLWLLLCGLSTAAAAGETWQVTIEGMDCAGCEAKIATMLESDTAILTAGVSYAKGQACVEGADDFSADRLRETLTTAGYTVGSIERAACGDSVRRHANPWEDSDGLDVQTISTGDKVKLATHLVPGKFTVVDFTAPWCGPCHLLARELKTYMGTHDDLAVRVIDLQGRSAGASFDLPVARQHLAFAEGLPYLHVYSPTGKKLYTGGVLAEAVAIIDGARTP